MFGRRFEHELKLLEGAQETEQGEKVLRAYLTPLVETTIDGFLLEHSSINERREVLIASAWKYLSTAIRNYLSRAEKMLAGSHDVFYFESYFRWFVRQGLVERFEDPHPLDVPPS